MNRLKFWYQNARPVSLPHCIIPSVTAIVLASSSADFSWWISLVAFLGIICTHLGINLADDYFDYKIGDGHIRCNINTDSIITEAYKGLPNKCTYLKSGETTLKQFYIVISILLSLAFIAAIVVSYFRGWEILIIGLLGLFFGILYSGFPFYLGYNGVGEIITGIVFGPLLMFGMYFSACKNINGKIIWISLAVGILIINILYTHSVMNIDTDKKTGKMTLARLLEKRKIVFSGLFTFTPFVIIIAGTVVHALHPVYLSTLILLPLAVYLNYSLTRFVHKMPTSDTPRFWMGPMGNFAKYKTTGIERILIRWFIARNMAILFCIVIIIGTLITELITTVV